MPRFEFIKRVSTRRRPNKSNQSSNRQSPSTSDSDDDYRGTDDATIELANVCKKRRYAGAYCDEETTELNMKAKENRKCAMKKWGWKCNRKGTGTVDEEPIEDFLEIVAKGNLEEFRRLCESDPTRLSLKCSKGLTAAHKAAQHGKLNILTYIKENNGDINAVDKHGNTPLHLAMKHKQKECVTYLLENGAKTDILNKEKMAPIHVGVEANARECLEALLDDPNVNPNLVGEKGMTALHYCGLKDRDACCRILLKHGSKPCIKCSNGFFPINLAGKNASAKTLDVLIKHVESLGYTREQVLTFSDKENNMPLHCAVNSGDLKAVQVCLEAGAPVDAKQEDQSTPLHFACAQGSLDMVEMMHRTQADRFQTAMKTEDVLNMTPLHRAAVFDHVNVVDFLIKHGADMNCQDSHDRTPLLLSASKGGWRTVLHLLKVGADYTVKDKDNRNFLHLAIKYRIAFDQFEVNVMKTVTEFKHVVDGLKGLKNLLNERDDRGCTPLHYASKEGHLEAIDGLLQLGATINLKDNSNKSTPFHFACRYGRVNTCRRLLESAMGPNIINETDGDGLSALHIAAQNGHTRIITVLMQKGAYVTKDNNNNSPVHLAAANGYTRSMKMMLTLYPNLLDCCNKDGNTALHLAALGGHPSAVDLLLSIGAQLLINKQEDTFMDLVIREKQTEVAFALIRHERWEEILSTLSSEYETPLNGLVQHLPEVCMVALDRCQTRSRHDERSPELNVHYNFRYLQSPIVYTKEKSPDPPKEYQPMLVLNTMVRHGRVRCLSHPVSEAFLDMKWRAYGSWFHISNLVAYIIFLSMFMILLTTCTYSIASHRHNVTDGNITDVTISECTMAPLQWVSAYFVLIFCCLNMVKEIGQMIHQRGKYFSELTNAFEWTLYITASLCTISFISGRTTDWQWETGTIAIFLAWFNCLLFLQRFDFFGIYVVMFLEILRTLIQVVMVFSILLIAFGMAFFILMNNETNNAFSTPGLSLLRTTMMMLELDFMASFNEPYTDGDVATMYFGGTTILLLVAFVLLMPILLMNLLIGLAVGDIESVQKNATLKRLAMQVELHTNLEHKLPQRLLKMVDKVEYRYYPNRYSSYVRRLWTKMSFMGDGDCSDGTMDDQAHIYQEMYKQKIRMKEMSATMTKQHELLRLIVQKMEIHTEDDNRDGDPSDIAEHQSKANKWFPVSHSVGRKSAVLAHWKNSMDSY